MSRYLLPLVLLSLMAVGVREKGTTLAISRSAADDSTIIQMLDLTFEPQTVTVPVGTRLIWTNNGQVVHTATADSGSFDAGDVAPGGTSTPVIVDQPGSFPYFCRYHGAPGGRGMAGTVVVVATGHPVFLPLVRR